MHINLDMINWCFHRLKAANFLEIGYRFVRILRLRILKLRSSIAYKQDYFSSESFANPRFFVEKGDIDFIRRSSIYSIEGSKIKQTEDLRCYADFMRDLEFNGNFKNDVKRRSGFSNADLKKTWESSRFQLLVGHAQRYVLEREEKTADKIVCILKDWIEKNQVLEGANWLDALEASLRLLSWTWVYFFTRDSVAFDKDFENIFLKSIYYHARFIESSLSRYSSANNHLIGEGVGLFVAGILFPQLKGSDKWLNKGKFILENEIKKQVYADGVAKEQSANYHRFITELYLLAVIIANKNGISFSRDTYARLEKMCEFLMYIMDKNGDLVSMGDSDDGIAIKLNILKDDKKAISILNTASILFNRADFKKSKDDIDEKTLWLLGQEGHRKYSLLKPENKALGSKGFLEGGYYVMRHNDLFLGFDCGQLGYLSLAAHGHADALNITLNAGGTNILVDPGTYLYHSGGRWRDYFRSTMAHNTVRIDRLDQSEIKGPFLWGHKAESRLKYWSPDGGYDKVCGYHTGYARLKDPVTHSREVIFDKLNGMITLKDSFRSIKRHFAEMFFHLHPDCSFKKLGKNSYEIKNGDVVVRMELDKDLNAYILEGQEYPICGWYSERFGEKVKAPAVCAENYFEGNGDFITKISVRHKK